MLHSTEAIRICSFCSTFTFSNYYWYTIAIHKLKLKLELSQRPAKQNYDLTVLHQIICDWIANQLVIDTEYSKKFVHG